VDREIRTSFLPDRCGAKVTSENRGIGPVTPAEDFIRSLSDARNAFAEIGVLPLEPLRSLTLVLTIACNLSCAYCYADRKGGRKMQWDVAQDALDLLRQAGRPNPRVFFYGGEPLLELPLIRRAVEYSESTWPPGRGPRFAVVTNGTLLDDEATELCVDHGIRIQLSFDGVEAAQRDRGPGTFIALDGFLRRIGRDHPAFYKTHLAVKGTLTARNLPHLAESIRYVLSLGVAEVSVVPMTTHDPDWDSQTVEVLEEQLARVREICVAHWRNTHEFPFTPFGGRLAGEEGVQDHWVMCGVGRCQGVVVDVDGAATACSSFIKSVQSVQSTLHGEVLGVAGIGNIRDLGFPGRLAACRDRIRNHPIFNQKIGKRSSYGVCRECRFLKSCFVCPDSIVHIPGNTDPHRIPDNQCGFNLVLGRQCELFERDLRRIGWREGGTSSN